MITERKIKICLKTLAPLHIGGRENPLTGIENAVTKIGEKLVIPGPSLKGALRHQLENYLIETYYDAQGHQWPEKQKALQPCMASTEASKEEAQLISKGKFRQISRGGKLQSCCTYPGELGICPVCYLLGAQGLTGFVRVPFLESDQRPDALYSGRVDRAKGTIAYGTNRSYELVQPGTVFQGTLVILESDNVRGWTFGKPRQLQDGQTPDLWLETGEWDAERILDELIVKRLQAISSIGGYLSKGFGVVQIKLSY
jgi:CRISPR/Cas system CSM-associated protein Csm3 (group 7 of RAMP superfamily)